MKLVQKWLTYSVLFIIIYYAIPLIPGVNLSFYGRLLTLTTPILCLVVGIVYGIVHKFDMALVALSGALFLPAIWFYYDANMFVYVLVYMGMTFIGLLPGLIKDLEK